MATHSFASIKVIIDDWLDTSGERIEELDEPLIKKFANDAIERISNDTTYVERIVLLDVDNYKAKLPDGFKYVIQAAYKLDPCEDRRRLREEVSQFTQKVLDGSGCELKINLDCPKCHQPACDCNLPVVEVDVNRIYEMANPQLFSSYMKHFTSYGNLTHRGMQSHYHPDFHLMRRTSNNFFNVPFHINYCPNFHVDSEVEYDIYADNDRAISMVVNFPKGEILLSYLGVPMDEDGYRLIPDVEIVFKAINYYIEERLAFRAYRRTKSNHDANFWRTMEGQQEKYIARARSQLQIPDPDEFQQFLNNHWRKLIPYYEHERNLNRRAKDRYQYPDQTNNIKGYYDHRNKLRRR